MEWTPAIIDYTARCRAAGHSPRTIRARVYWVRRFTRDHDGPLSSVTEDHLIAWIAQPGWSAGTRRVIRGAFKSFFAWAAHAGHIASDPAAGLPVVRVRRRRVEPTPDDLLEYALTTAPSHYVLAIELAAYAGLRRAEIAGLRRENLTADGLLVLGKGDKWRLVPVADWLRAEIEARPRGYLFPARNGAPGHMHVDSLGKGIRLALRRESSAHKLRHRFATRAYAGTHDIRAVQELLGHASPETTAGYITVDADALAAAVAAAA